MFRGKTDKVNKQPNKNSKLIYTSNYIARAASSALTDQSDDSLDGFEVDRYSQKLSECFNYFFQPVNKLNIFLKQAWKS